MAAASSFHQADREVSLAGEDRPVRAQTVKRGSALGSINLLEPPVAGIVDDPWPERFRLAHDYGAAKPLIAQLFAHIEKETVEEAQAGLAYATEHEKELAGVSFAAYLEGELATFAKDFSRAEKAYGRALSLDATSDPLATDGLYWASKDGHGTALWGLKKYEDAARELRPHNPFNAAVHGFANVVASSTVTS